MYKFIVLATALACANAGLIGAPLAATYAAPSYSYGHAVAPAAITSQSANILRSYGNLGQVSTYHKTIDTPYSSVSKSDIRVSNPGYAAVAPVAYHAPAYAPAAYAAAPVVAKAYSPYAPAAYAPATYATAPVVAKAYSPYAPAAYAAAPAVAAHGLLGVAYSAAPTVAHVSYDSPIVHYAL